MSDENRLTRQEMIIQTQTAFAQAMMMLDPSVPEMFDKVRRPYADTLRVLGIKDVDAYLPTIEEAAKMAQSKAQQGPGPEQQETMSKVDLNKAKTELNWSAKIELKDYIKKQYFWSRQQFVLPIVGGV